MAPKDICSDKWSLVLPIILDTGASLVVLPADVLHTLTETGSVAKSDFIGKGSATLADGSKYTTDHYVLREVRVGDHTVQNVVASVMPANGEPLLGQSFLSKLPGWAIDNAHQGLVITDEASSTQSSPTAPTRNRGVKPARNRCCAPSIATSSPPAAGHYGAIAWDQNTGNRAWSWGWDTPAGADVAALRECSASGCKVILRIAGAMCAALATTETGEYAGAAGHHDGDTARLAALANCQKGNVGDCIIRMTACNQ